MGFTCGGPSCQLIFDEEESRGDLDSGDLNSRSLSPGVGTYRTAYNLQGELDRDLSYFRGALVSQPTSTDVAELVLGVTDKLQLCGSSLLQQQQGTTKRA